MRLLPVLVVSSAIPLGSFAVRLGAQQPIVVGVLEQPMCKESAPPSVRAMFLKRAETWEPLDSPEAARRIALPMEWTIAFDGRDRGRVSTVAPDSVKWSDFYSRDRVLPLRTGQSPLRVSNTGTAFRGWCEPPAVRPLVVVSQSNATDPDGWRPFTITRSDIDRIHPAFRALRDSTIYCPNGDPRGDEKPVPFRFVAGDIVALGGYQDRHGRRLANVRLRPDRYGCDGVRDDDWYNHWFDLGDSVRFVMIGATLVDAGDYDRDGKSELVFWTSESHHDGYALLLSDLRTRFNYTWSYH